MQQQQHETGGQGEQRAPGEARHEEGEERHGSHRQRIRQLRDDVVEVVALSTRRRQDGGVGNRRAVVAAHGTRHAGRDGNHHEFAVDALEAGNHDGNQNAERAPRRARSEGQAHGDNKDDGGQEVHQAGGSMRCEAGYIGCCPQAVRHMLQRPGKHQNQYGGNHLAEALGQAVHTVAERCRAAQQIICHGERKGYGRAHHQSQRGIALGKGGDEVLATEETARVNHADDTADDEKDHGNHQVGHAARRSAARRLSTGRALFAGGEEVAAKGIPLVLQHGTVVELHDGDEDNHRQRQQRVEVEGDGLDEEADAVFIFDEPRHRSGPRRERCDDADGRRSGVDEIGQFGAADPMLVGDGSHDGTHGEAVEVVVDENQTAQQHRGQLCPHPAPDMAGGPETEGRRAAGAVHHLHHGAQDNQKEQDADVPLVGEHGDDAVREKAVDAVDRVEVAVEHGARQYAEKQGTVDLSGDQCHEDGNEGRCEGPHGVLHRHVFVGHGIVQPAQEEHHGNERRVGRRFVLAGFYGFYEFR